MKVTNMVKQIPMKHLAFFSLLCSSAASAAERPNIIYISGCSRAVSQWFTDTRLAQDTDIRHLNKECRI